jgi:hypothetical protein
MILRVSLEGVDAPSTPKIFSTFLDDNCAVIIEELSKIKNDWVKFAIDNI